MASTTTVLGLPFPQDGDDNDVTADLEALALRVDEVPGVEALTNSEIAALTSGQKSTGRVVYNTTTSKLQQWSGSAWVNVDAAALAAAAAAQATADAATTVVYAIGVRLGSSQSVASGATSTVTFTSETDAAGILAYASGVFTIPSDGVWHVDASIDLQLLAVSGTFQIKRNGGLVNSLHLQGTSNGGISATFFASATDVITTTFTNGAGDSRNINGARVSLHKVGVE